MVSGTPAIYPQERPGTHFTGGWVGLRAGLDGCKISSPSHSKKNRAKYDKQCRGFSCHILNFLDRFSKKCSNIKFQEKQSRGSRVAPCGQTDRHEESDSPFRNSTKAPENELNPINISHINAVHTHTPISLTSILKLDYILHLFLQSNLCNYISPCDFQKQTS